MGKNRLNENIVFAIKLAVVLAIILGIANFIMQTRIAWITVDGNSMFPTLRNKETVIVSKTLRKDKPERFDIIVFETNLSETGYYIKRVIGLPGEHVVIDDNGYIYINGKIIEEDYGYEQLLDAGRARIGVDLGEDEYFVLGDNRNHSEDSRFSIVGNISREDILGIARIRALPIEKYGYIDLYTERHQDDAQ